MALECDACGRSAGVASGYPRRQCPTLTPRHVRDRGLRNAEPHGRGPRRVGMDGPDVRHRAVCRTPSRCAVAPLATRLHPLAGSALHLVDFLRHRHPGGALWLAAATDLHRRDPVLHAGTGVHDAAGAIGARQQCHLDRRPDRHASGQGCMAGRHRHPGRRAGLDPVHRPAIAGDHPEPDRGDRGLWRGGRFRASLLA